MKKLIAVAAFFLAGCATAPNDIAHVWVVTSSVMVQCNDEHEPVLTLGENRTVGVITCVKK